MKISDVKKILSGASMEIFCTSGNYGIMSAAILIRYRNEFGNTRFPELTCQCNDKLHPENRDSTARVAERGFRTFPEYSGFYALKAHCVESFTATFRDSESPDKARALFGAVRRVAESKNLFYVYPDCELSVFVASVMELGLKESEISVTVDRAPYRDWLRARSEKIRVRQESNQTSN